MAFSILSLCMIAGYAALLVRLSQGFGRIREIQTKATPQVSVIVPARNEEENLPALLERLARQTYPRTRVEFLLVDDRSGDRTFGIMQSRSRQDSRFKAVRIRRVPDGMASKKHAIAKAVALARGDVVITTDADCLPGRNWIRSLVQTYTPETGAVIGYAPYRTDPPYDGLGFRLLALEYFSLGAVSAAAAGIGYPVSCNGANFSYRKEVFRTVGGFGSTLRMASGDDDLLLHRIRYTGGYQVRFALHRESAVWTKPPENVKAFFWQRIRFSSKHLAYPAQIRKLLALAYACHVLLFVLLMGLLLSKICLYGFLAVAGIKALAESFFLSVAQKHMENRNLLQFYPLIFLPHLLYIVFVPPLAQILRPRWK